MRERLVQHGGPRQLRQAGGARRGDGREGEERGGVSEARGCVERGGGEKDERVCCEGWDITRKGRQLCYPHNNARVSKHFEVRVYKTRTRTGTGFNQ